jgi:D-ribose pyranase
MMKKHGVLNHPICSVIAKMGHQDRLTICDAGLPIPDGVERIDLAVVPGLPGFLQVVEAVAEAVEIEGVVLAEEIKEHNPEIEKALLELFPDLQVVYRPHAEFKQMTAASRAIIRTGECTPYANVIFISGVIF